MKKVTVWFDMDGTIADLYGHEDWLKRLRNDDASIFLELKPMLYISEAFEQIKSHLEKVGIIAKIGIITWTPMEATYKFEKECERTKRDWIETFYPAIDEFYAIPYGTPKQSAINLKQGLHILVDDNEEVRRVWNTKVRRRSINAKKIYDEYFSDYGYILVEQIIELSIAMTQA
jgi:hypothetical protein